MILTLSIYVVFKVMKHISCNWNIYVGKVYIREKFIFPPIDTSMYSKLKAWNTFSIFSLPPRIRSNKPEFGFQANFLKKIVHRCLSQKLLIKVASIHDLNIWHAKGGMNDHTDYWKNHSAELKGWVHRHNIHKCQTSTLNIHFGSNWGYKKFY